MASNRYLSWLSSEIVVRNTYHNQKETMAWVVTALYLPGIIVLGYYINKSGWEPCYIFLLLLPVFAISLAFVLLQFHLRSKAADTIIALMNVVSNLCNDPNYLRNKDREVEAYRAGKPWPKFIETEIEKAKGKGRPPYIKWLSDGVTFAAMVLATIVALVMAWPNS